VLDVTALRVVRAIGDEGGFTAAAVALGTTQPAVSQLVRRLEQRLGTALVERSGRRMRLTEAGEVLDALRGLRAGTVRLSAFPSAAATIVPRALARMRGEHPALRVRLAEAEPPQSIAALRSGRCDVAVAFGYPEDDGSDLAGLVRVPLTRDEVHAVLPRDHRLAARASVSVADLADEDWIAGCPRCRSHLLALAARVDVRPRVQFETDDSAAVVGLVAAGVGVALLPGLALGALPDDVVVLPLRPASHRTVLAVTTPDLARVRAVDAVLAALAAASVSR
jgi:DNA-binding transcriptional LysR family regulator